MDNDDTRDRLLAATDQSPGWRALLQGAIDEIDALRRERDEARTERNVEADCRANAVRKRDAAMALLRSFTADGYCGGACSSDPDGGGSFTLYYRTIEQAERAFNVATGGTDAMLGGEG